MRSTIHSRSALYLRMSANFSRELKMVPMWSSTTHLLNETLTSQLERLLEKKQDPRRVKRSWTSLTPASVVTDPRISNQNQDRILLLAPAMAAKRCWSAMAGDRFIGRTPLRAEKECYRQRIWGSETNNTTTLVYTPYALVEFSFPPHTSPSLVL